MKISRQWLYGKRCLSSEPLNHHPINLSQYHFMIKLNMSRGTKFLSLCKMFRVTWRKRYKRFCSFCLLKMKICIKIFPNSFTTTCVKTQYIMHRENYLKIWTNVFLLTQAFITIWPLKLGNFLWNCDIYHLNPAAAYIILF